MVAEAQAMIVAYNHYFIKLLQSNQKENKQKIQKNQKEKEKGKGTYRRWSCKGDTPTQRVHHFQLHFKTILAYSSNHKD